MSCRKYIDISNFWICALVAGLLFPSICLAADLYVIERPRGIITFTNIKPKSGTKARKLDLATTKFSYKNFSSKTAESCIPLELNKYSNTISNISKEYNVEASLVRAVIQSESNFDPNAVSPKGAAGLMQLMPSTAKSVGVVDLYKPSENIKGGVKYLKRLLKRYRWNTRLALAAYNAGPSNVEKYGGIPPYPETQKYVRKVVNLQNRYRCVERGRVGC